MKLPLLIYLSMWTLLHFFLQAQHPYHLSTTLFRKQLSAVLFKSEQVLHQPQIMQKDLPSEGSLIPRAVLQLHLLIAVFHTTPYDSASTCSLWMVHFQNQGLTSACSLLLTWVFNLCFPIAINTALSFLPFKHFSNMPSTASNC